MGQWNITVSRKNKQRKRKSFKIKYISVVCFGLSWPWLYSWHSSLDRMHEDWADLAATVSSSLTGPCS